MQPHKHTKPQTTCMQTGKHFITYAQTSDTQTGNPQTAAMQSCIMADHKWTIMHKWFPQQRTCTIDHYQRVRPFGFPVCAIVDLQFVANSMCNCAFAVCCSVPGHLTTLFISITLHHSFIIFCTSIIFLWLHFNLKKLHLLAHRRRDFQRVCSHPFTNCWELNLWSL